MPHNSSKKGQKEKGKKYKKTEQKLKFRKLLKLNQMKNMKLTLQRIWKIRKMLDSPDEFFHQKNNNKTAQIKIRQE